MLGWFSGMTDGSVALSKGAGEYSPTFSTMRAHRLPGKELTFGWNVAGNRFLKLMRMFALNDYSNGSYILRDSRRGAESFPIVILASQDFMVELICLYRKKLSLREWKKASTYHTGSTWPRHYLNPSLTAESTSPLLSFSIWVKRTQTQ